MKLYELVYFKDNVHVTVYEYGDTYMEARSKVIQREGYIKFESVKEVKPA